MSNIEHTWVLASNDADQKIKRHCRSCGRTMLFSDTNIRRHNSNGKNVYRYAIYKCENDHTWNNKLAVYKAFTDHRDVPDLLTECDGAPALSRLALSDYLELGIQEITIVLGNVDGQHRIDKVLAERLDGWSRTQIIQKIKSAKIVVNLQPIKPSATLAAGDVISIRFDEK